MSEMTMPEVPESRKPTNWKVIITVVILVIVGCLCLLVLGVLAYTGSQGNGPFAFLQELLPQTGKSITGDWSVYYDWNCTGSYYGPAVVSFYADQTYAIAEGGNYSYGAWRMSGSTVEFIFDEYPNSHYLGTVDDASTYMEGTMTNADGGSGCWYASR